MPYISGIYPTSSLSLASGGHGKVYTNASFQRRPVPSLPNPASRRSSAFEIVFSMRFEERTPPHSQSMGVLFSIDGCPQRPPSLQQQCVIVFSSWSLSRGPSPILALPPQAHGRLRSRARQTHDGDPVARSPRGRLGEGGGATRVRPLPTHPFGRTNSRKAG